MIRHRVLDPPRVETAPAGSFNAANEVASLYGDGNTQLTWPRPLAQTFTVCWAARYHSTTSQNNNILGFVDDGSHLGHDNNNGDPNRGRARVEGYFIASGSNYASGEGSDRPITNWLVVCWTNGRFDRSSWIIDQKHAKTNSLDAPDPVFDRHTLGVNHHSPSQGDFNIHSVYVWDEELSADEMKNVTRGLRTELGGIPDWATEAIAPVSDLHAYNLRLLTALRLSNVATHNHCVQCPLNRTTAGRGSAGADACTCDAESGETDPDSGVCIAFDKISCTNSMKVQPNQWSPCLYCPAYYDANADHSECVRIKEDDIKQKPLGACSRNQVTTHVHKVNGFYYLECTDCPLVNESLPEAGLMFAGRGAMVETEQCGEGCRPGTFITERAPLVSSDFLDGIPNTHLKSWNCTACPSGHYTSKFSEVACTACAAGSYTGFDREATGCLTTPAGTWSDVGASSYSICEAGSSAGAGASECTPCAEGNYNPYAQAARCYPCLSGLRTTGEGSEVCVSCDVGYESYQAKECISCLKGTKGVPGAGGAGATCEVCPVGFFQGELGASECTPCAEGNYNPYAQAARCYSCPSGLRTTGEGSEVCVSCDVGYESYQAKECSICSKGTKGVPGAGGAGATCEECPVGFFQGELGASECTPCAEGNYNPYAQAARCYPCPSGLRTTGEGSEVCVSCDVGYESYQAKECSKCLKGTKGVPGAGGAGATCEECPVGFFQGELGATTCKECPSALSAGATECVPDTTTAAPTTTPVAAATTTTPVPAAPTTTTTTTAAAATTTTPDPAAPTTTTTTTTTAAAATTTTPAPDAPTTTTTTTVTAATTTTPAPAAPTTTTTPTPDATTTPLPKTQAAVKFSIVLQMTLSEFTEVAPALTQAIAEVANVAASRVSITGVLENDARRRLLGSGLQVDYSIQTPDEGPGVVTPVAVAASLTPINIQKEMRKSVELEGVAETLVVASVAVDGEKQAAVKFSMVLQVTASQFAEVSPAVLQAVASVAGVDPSRVSIIGFSETAYARRRLLGGAVQVNYLIETPNAGPGVVSTTTVAASLTSSNMRSTMQDNTDLQSVADTVVVLSVFVVDGESEKQAAVKFSMVLQMTASQFAEVGPAVLQSVASVAGVDPSRVRVVGFSETAYARRRLLGGAVQVDYLIETPDAGLGVVSTTTVAASLTSSSMRSTMQDNTDLQSFADTVVVLSVVVVDGESEKQAAVRFSMVLQVTASQFSEVGPAVLQAVASVAGVDPSRVSIIGFSEIAYARRRLLGSAVQVDYLIETPDAGPGVVSTTTVAESLTSSNMRSAMQDNTDLQSIADTVVILSVVVVGSLDTTTTTPPPPPPPPQDPETALPLALYGVIGGVSLLFVIAAVVCCVCFYRHNENDVEIPSARPVKEGRAGMAVPRPRPVTIDVCLHPPYRHFDMQSQAMALYEHTRKQRQQQERQLLLPSPGHGQDPYTVHGFRD